MSGPTRPEPRIGDVEREGAVSALGEHYAAGRLTREEHDERSGRALTARTASELWPLFADLPPLHGPATASRPHTAAGATRATTSVPPSRSWREPWLLRIALTGLLVLVVVTHLPLLLLLLLGVWLWSRAAGRGRCWSGQERWSGRVR